MSAAPPAMRACCYCGQLRALATGRGVIRVGWCCAECVAALQVAPPQAPRGCPTEGSRKRRKTIVAPWTAREADKPTTPAAEPVAAATVEPGVKVTICPSRPDTRYCVAPGERAYGAGFMAEWRALRKGAAHG